MNIFIADDHAILRKGLVHLMKEEFPFSEVTEAHDGLEIYEKIIKKLLTKRLHLLPWRHGW